MKKILTFLVMLFATVSILSAQNPKFNYQAVVRDVFNSHNLVINEPCKVTVTVYNQAGTKLYEEELNGTTNRNGMISLVIGENDTENALDTIDWSDAYISADFEVRGKVVSTVITDVMAVPYAIQAKNDQLSLTTKKICDYLKSSNVGKPQMDSIIQAIVDNPNGLKQNLKDTVYGYIKANKSDVKALALYFLGKIEAEDFDAAKDTLSQEVKDKVKELVIQYLKDHKDAAYEVLNYYLTQASLQNVKDIWNAARANDNFDTLFKMAQDSVIEYIKNHEELVVEIGLAYINNATAEQVNKVYNYLKTNQPVAYQYMLNKFQNYLNHYLSEVYYAVSDSCTKAKGTDRIDICQLSKQIDQIVETDCDDFEAFAVNCDAINGCIANVTLKTGATYETADFKFYYKTSATADAVEITPVSELNEGEFQLEGLPADHDGYIIVARWRDMCVKEVTLP